MYFIWKGNREFVIKVFLWSLSESWKNGEKNVLLTCTMFTKNCNEDSTYYRCEKICTENWWGERHDYIYT